MPPTRFLSLTEYQTSGGVALTPEEVRALRTVTSSVAVSPSITGDGAYDLTPGSWIGAINLGTVAIEIVPKLSVRQVLFLISYALDPRRWMQTRFDFGEERSLVEAIIPGFMTQVRRALRRGVRQGYRVEEAALPGPRGRIRFEDQVRNRFGLVPPVEVRYDDYTPDIEENRLIKAAIARLGRLPIRSAALRASLRTFDAALAMVDLVEYDPRQLPSISYTRLNEHYRPAVELAKLLLRSTSVELRHGNVRAVAFLVDMNKVFEDFVVTALREALDVSERTLPQGARGKRLVLDLAAMIHLKPDISWWEGHRCLFVGDVKYKRVAIEGILHPDLYQLLAYAVGADLPGGLLIYAAGEGEPAIHRVRHVGKELQVITLDLSVAPEVTLQQINDIAQRVRALRRAALHVMASTTSAAGKEGVAFPRR